MNKKSVGRPKQYKTAITKLVAFHVTAEQYEKLSKAVDKAIEANINLNSQSAFLRDLLFGKKGAIK